MKLDGASVIVTGGAQNIGLGIAQRLRALGAKVAVLDLAADKLSESGDPELLAIACDVADPAAAQAAVARVIEKFGRIDVLVNAAGWICSAPLYNVLDRAGGKHDVELFEKALRSNLTTTFVMSACVVEAMARARTKGLLINISSVAAQGNAGQSAYAAAKAGVNALAITWAKELGALGIRAVAIAPGFIDTPTTHAAMSAERLQEWVRKVPLRGLGLIEHVAQAVVFAAENDYVNGTVIEVDGGLSL